MYASDSFVFIVSADQHLCRSLHHAAAAGGYDNVRFAFAADTTLWLAIERAMGQAEEQRAQIQQRTALQQRWNQLSTREREVFQMIVGGCLNKQAASELGISEATVKVHRGRVMKKMLADSFADLVRMAALIDLPLVGGRHGMHGATPDRTLEVDDAALDCNDHSMGAIASIELR
jgi:DNA-binding NarL/FixJ family response regulator